MAKLALFIRQDDIFSDAAVVLFPCSSRDASNFSRYLGSPILIANVAPPFAEGFLALGKLEAFKTDGNHNAAVVSAIRNFPGVVPFRQPNPSGPGLFEISDAAFHDVVGLVIGNEFDEAATRFWSGTSTSRD